VCDAALPWPDRRRTIEALTAGWEAFAEHVVGTSAADWDRETRCPGWQVRDVAGHVTGTASDAANGQPGYRSADEQAAAFRHLSPDEMARALRDAATVLAPGLEAIEEAQWTMPFGERFASLGEAIQTLLHDLYIHGDDIAESLGCSPWSGPGLDAAIATVARRLERTGVGTSDDRVRGSTGDRTSRRQADHSDRSA
jgi:uncharacterized protein (TIGR03083 family)